MFQPPRPEVVAPVLLSSTAGLLISNNAMVEMRKMLEKEADYQD